MAHSFTNLLYHIVFTTKDRKAMLKPLVTERLYAYLGGSIRQDGGTALAVNGTANHVHILAKLRQDKTVSDVLRGIKANASRWLHQTFPTHASFAWQSGYGAFTVSASQVERVRRYIAEQETHHRTMTFEEEWAAILKAHGIAFDAESWR